jgi:phage gp46-like protein
VFDGVLYVDSLLEDMRVQGHKGKGWWKDSMDTVLPADLGKAWEEYLKKAE